MGQIKKQMQIIILDDKITGAYLGFEITGANKKFSPVFFIDRFL